MSKASHAKGFEKDTCWLPNVFLSFPLQGFGHKDRSPPRVSFSNPALSLTFDRKDRKDTGLGPKFTSGHFYPLVGKCPADQAIFPAKPSGLL
jgi:hypothetical protein